MARPRSRTGRGRSPSKAEGFAFDDTRCFICRCARPCLLCAQPAALRARLCSLMAYQRGCRGSPLPGVWGCPPETHLSRAGGWEEDANVTPQRPGRVQGVSPAGVTSPLEIGPSLWSNTSVRPSTVLAASRSPKSQLPKCTRFFQLNSTGQSNRSAPARDGITHSKRRLAGGPPKTAIMEPEEAHTDDTHLSDRRPHRARLPRRRRDQGQAGALQQPELPR